MISRFEGNQRTTKLLTNINASMKSRPRKNSCWCQISLPVSAVGMLDMRVVKILTQYVYPLLLATISWEVLQQTTSYFYAYIKLNCHNSYCCCVFVFPLWMFAVLPLFHLELIAYSILPILLYTDHCDSFWMNTWHDELCLQIQDILHGACLALVLFHLWMNLQLGHFRQRWIQNLHVSGSKNKR